MTSARKRAQRILGPGNWDPDNCWDDDDPTSCCWSNVGDTPCFTPDNPNTIFSYSYFWLPYSYATYAPTPAPSGSAAPTLEPTKKKSDGAAAVGLGLAAGLVPLAAML